MPSRQEIRDATKAAIDAQQSIAVFTGRTITEEADIYATVVIANPVSRNKFISSDTVKETTAELQVVIYVMTNEDDTVIDNLADAIEVNITASQTLNNLLDELEYRGIEEVDEAQGYEALALIFDITYQP
jgi:hypothetical protein